MSDLHKWDVLQQYCTDRKEKDPVTCGSRVPLGLQFDVNTRTWSDAGGFDAAKRKVDFDPVTRLPIVAMKPGETLGVKVIANPLLFLVNRGESKEENIEQIKALEQLLQLAGGLTQTAFADLGSAIVWNDGQREQYRSFAAALDDAPVAAVVARRAALDEKIEDKSVLEADLKRFKEWTETAEQSYKTLRERLALLRQLRADLQLTAQSLETQAVTFDQVRLLPELENVNAWRQQFETVTKYLDNAPKLAQCAPHLEQAAAALSTTPPEPTGVDAAAIRFLQAAPDEKKYDAPPCPAVMYSYRILATFRNLRQVAGAAARAPGDATLQRRLAETTTDARDRHMEHVMTLAAAARKLQVMRATLEEVVTKEDEVRKAALVLAGITVRLKDAATRWRQGQQFEIQRAIYLPDERYSAAWNKVRQNTIQVALNSPYAEAVPTSTAKDIASSYRIVRTGFDKLSFGVGLVYTPVYNGVYAAVDPDPALNTQTTVSTQTGGPPPDPVTTVTSVSPEGKVIVEKERQPRAGAYAVFANYAFAGSAKRGWGLQTGVAVSTDNPAVFVAPMVNVGPYLTAAVGVGVFRVKTLKGQDVGATVYSADEILLKNAWKPHVYVSVSVNISGLPVFK